MVHLDHGIAMDAQFLDRHNPAPLAKQVAVPSQHRVFFKLRQTCFTFSAKVRRSFGTAFGPRFIIFSWRNDRLIVRAVFGIVSCVTACFGPCNPPSIDQHCIELTNQLVFIQHHVKTELLGGIPLVWSSAGRPSEIPTLLPNLTLDVVKLKSCEIGSLRQDSVPTRLTSLTAI